ncbi:Uncharacterised protein [uncultured archaeon]|nr:Uncharacterised protein [uncultured archaeon]
MLAFLAIILVIVIIILVIVLYRQSSFKTCPSCPNCQTCPSDCPHPCVYDNWSSWSDCNPDTKTITRNRNLVEGDKVLCYDKTQTAPCSEATTLPTPISSLKVDTNIPNAVFELKRGFVVGVLPFSNDTKGDYKILKVPPFLLNQFYITTPNWTATTQTKTYNFKALTQIDVYLAMYSYGTWVDSNWNLLKETIDIQGTTIGGVKLYQKSYNKGEAVSIITDYNTTKANSWLIIVPKTPIQPCVYSNWGDWSACNASSQTMTKSRNIQSGDTTTCNETNMIAPCSTSTSPPAIPSGAIGVMRSQGGKYYAGYSNDHWGDDIQGYNPARASSIAELMNLCDGMENCKSFNNQGYLKSKTNPDGSPDPKGTLWFYSKMN